MLVAESADDRPRTAGAAKGGDGGGNKWQRGGDGGGAGGPGVLAGSAGAAEAASQPVRSTGPASESAGMQRAMGASMAVTPSRTGAEAEVGVSGVRSRVAHCGGTIGQSEFTSVVSVLWLGPEWVGHSGQSMTPGSVGRHMWGKIRAEDERNRLGGSVHATCQGASDFRFFEIG